jgi:hypothetical protein
MGGVAFHEFAEPVGGHVAEHRFEVLIAPEAADARPADSEMRAVAAGERDADLNVIVQRLT